MKVKELAKQKELKKTEITVEIIKDELLARINVTANQVKIKVAFESENQIQGTITVEEDGLIIHISFAYYVMMDALEYNTMFLAPKDIKVMQEMLKGVA